LLGLLSAWLLDLLGLPLALLGQSLARLGFNRQRGSNALDHSLVLDVFFLFAEYWFLPDGLAQGFRA
jgi:hypothetical protein